MKVGGNIWCAFIWIFDDFFERIKITFSSIFKISTFLSISESNYTTNNVLFLGSKTYVLSLPMSSIDDKLSSSNSNLTENLRKTFQTKNIEGMSNSQSQKWKRSFSKFISQYFKIPFKVFFNYFRMLST